MPLYKFRKISTNEEFEESMSWAARRDFLKDKDIEPVVCAPAIVSGISGITYKTDGGFNDMLSRVAEANPASPLANEYGKKDIKSSKIREIAQKHDLA